MKFKYRIINLALKFVDLYFISQIKVVSIQDYLSSKLDIIKDVVEIFMDKNPENTTQLIELWNKIKDDLATETLDTALEIVKSKIKDPGVREMICVLIETEIAEQRLAAHR